MNTTTAATMKAISYRRYGGPEVLEHGDVSMPEPAAGEVLLRVRAASVNPYEWHFMRGLPYMMRPISGWGGPKFSGLGADVAGVVEAVGGGVTGLTVGDEVFGIAKGSYAQYAIATESSLARKPEGVSFEDAAATPLAAQTALQALRNEGRVAAGERVLVIGASGGVGIYAVQLARALGAEVDAVTSTRNVELVSALGANRTIDYTKQDVTALPARYDVILDIAGGARVPALRKLLSEDGRLVLVGGPGDGKLLGPAGRVLRALLTAKFVKEHVSRVDTRWSAGDLRFIAEHLADGRIRSVIDRRYALEGVPEAIAYVEEGHARGKVVITVS